MMMNQMIHDPCPMSRRQSHASCSTSSASHWTSKCRPDGLVRSGRKVSCRNVNEFRQSFQSNEPGRSNQHPDGDEAPAARTAGVGSIGHRTYQVIGDQLPPYVQKRLAEDGPPGAGAALLEELAVLDEESQRWPSISRRKDGSFSFSPGFLLRLIEPLPAEFVLGNGFWQVFQLAVVAAYAAAAVMAAKFALESNFNLGLALVVTWARDLLTPGRLLMICAMAWFGNLWLYWVFFVGARVDDILREIAPPIRAACWMAFSLWLAYVLISPVWHHPTPWFVFAPGNSPFQHMNLMRS